MTPKAGARRALIAAFTERLPYKAAALFFAIALWLVLKYNGRAP